MNECYPAPDGDSFLGAQRLRGEPVSGGHIGLLRKEVGSHMSRLPFENWPEKATISNQRIDQPILAILIINLKAQERPSLDTPDTAPPKEGKSGETLQNLLVKKSHLHLLILSQSSSTCWSAEAQVSVVWSQDPRSLFLI